MRWSQYYLHTTRETPREAEVVSHQLMLRAGMIKKLAAGIYTYLPTGWRSIRKLEDIVRRELAEAGSVELSMPAVQPAELWQETDRWDIYGHLLLRMKDRNDRDFCFGPTHEEVITDLVRQDVRSYRQLPINLYQIQTKFRDEIRPRFGLMRGREFIMKDAYTFHATEESLHEAYEAMRAAYCRIFEACGLEYSVVEADSGQIGGSSSHEFMVLAETGEDAVVRCDACHYAANVEKAELPERGSDRPEPSGREMREVATPNARTIGEVSSFLEVAPEQVVKTLIYATESGHVAVVLRGDRELNEIKLGRVLGTDKLTLAGEDAVREITGAATGFAGPIGLSGVRVVGDWSARGLVDFVCGANRDDAHLVDVNWGRDAEVDQWADLAVARGGDPCPRCDGTLEEFRGIEVGHIFKLGTKYSEAMGCTYLDDEGQEHPMLMGCYGLGIGRTVAAAIEQNHDENGIQWPRPLAPFDVALVGLDLARNDAVRETAERVYRELRERGLEVFFDDRDERPGVKFNDADLIGLPMRVTIGARALERGELELSNRRTGERFSVPLDEGVDRIVAALEA